MRDVPSRGPTAAELAADPLLDPGVRAWYEAVRGAFLRGGGRDQRLTVEPTRPDRPIPDGVP